MKTVWIASSLMALLAVLPAPAQEKAAAALWLTNPDKSALFEPQKPSLGWNSGEPASGPIIEVDERQAYQPIDGFGFALTGGSAMHLIRMNAETRAALLKELFATEGTNIGISYLRVSIGASDLNARVFTYDDLPDGETDLEMAKFSLEPDRADVIPVLKEILAINPDIKILGSPWTAPAWMKTNGNSKVGNSSPSLTTPTPSTS